jgi:hypothetical protein
MTITNASGGTTTVTSTVALSPMTPLYITLLMTCLPAALSAAAGLGFIALARSRLHSTFRQLAARSLAPARAGPASTPAARMAAPPVMETRQT